ncbi:MAG: TIGR00266 family protein [Sphaerospermopsis sp.]|nr:TIGR00266 family protein [Sphaerospermopsis sp.]
MSRKSAHQIDFKIFGDDMQLVEIELDPEESVIAEAGAMTIMTEAIEMRTIFGDDSGGEDNLMDKLLGAGKRLITGESLFMTIFTNKGQGKQHVSFAAPYPGKIIPMDLQKLEGKIICQKDSFLCGAKGVAIGMEFTRKLGTGFFGGEGFILQKLEGDGLAFVHGGGTVIEKELKTNEVLRVDTGCLVAMTKEVEYDIQMVKGLKSMFFGNEGLFFATLKGPGKVWIQSLPLSKLANRIYSAATVAGGHSSK